MKFKSLLKSCCSGDSSAWDEFIDEFHPLIAGSVRNVITRDNEDIVQAVYEKLIERDYRMLRTFNGEYEQFIVYLMRVAKNIAGNHLKKYARLSSKNTELTEAIENHLSTTQEDPEFIFIENEQFDEMFKAINELDTGTREVVYYLSQGHKYKEIASIMSIPINTALTRGRRGLKKLQHLLKNEIKTGLQEIH